MGRVYSLANRATVRLAVTYPTFDGMSERIRTTADW